MAQMARRMLIQQGQKLAEWDVVVVIFSVMGSYWQDVEKV
jgi:hypothetical protein